MSQPGRIPLELVLLILEHIAAPLQYRFQCYGDSKAAQKAAKKNLTKCSLVSRSWVGIAQSLLFQDVELCIPLVELPNGSLGTNPDFWDEFLDFIRRSPHIRSRLHSLYIRWAFETARIPTEELDIHFVAKLIEYLPRLQVLQIFHAASIPTTPISTFPPSLHTFRLSTPFGLPMDDPLRILSLFHNVQTLFLDGLNFDLGDLVPSAGFIGFSNLTSLHIRSCTTLSHILRHLATIAGSSLPHLNEATFGSVHPRDTIQLTKFMESTDGRLRILTLELVTHISQEHFGGIDFYRCKSLTTLGFRVNVDIHTLEDMYVVWERLVQVLQGSMVPDGGPSPLLQTLVINSTATSYYVIQDLAKDEEDDEDEDDEDYDVECLSDSMQAFEDTILAMPTPFRRIIFLPSKQSASNTSTFDKTQRDYVRAAFPEFDGRGLIQFERDIDGH